MPVEVRHGVQRLEEDLGDGLWREGLGARREVVVEQGNAQLREEEEEEEHWRFLDEEILQIKVEAYPTFFQLIFTK